MTSTALRGIAGDKVRSAAAPARTVALTYDGGPDPEWTPRLLDLLREHHAHATFFVFGAQAARHPDLVRRILDEGHEIGSNTYTGADLGSSSRLRFGMELGLTQQTLAGTAGIRTHLLRMPMTTEVDTLCGAEWQAARKAAADGYVLVAADRPGRDPAHGLIRQFSETELAYDETKQLLDDPHADRFTTVTDAVGMPPADTRVSPAGRWQSKALNWTVAAGNTFTHIMTWVLVVAGALGLLRLLSLTFFARAHVRRLTRPRPGAPWLREVDAPVTVLVPAYNEEAGIESTVRSLLAATHPHLEVIVIDDGSTDRTADLATWIDDPRVRVIRQPNSGKAAALNTGLANASHDIVVMVDADTVFEPDALYRLIQPLAHPAVGAVSGNTKVGNRRGLLGRWQHLEYVFGFNLDRRMFEVLECMPTFPAPSPAQVPLRPCPQGRRPGRRARPVPYVSRPERGTGHPRRGQGHGTAVSAVAVPGDEERLGRGRQAVERPRGRARVPHRRRECPEVGRGEGGRTLRRTARRPAGDRRGAGLTGRTGVRPGKACEAAGPRAVDGARPPFPSPPHSRGEAGAARREAGHAALHPAHGTRRTSPGTVGREGPLVGCDTSVRTRAGSHEGVAANGARRSARNRNEPGANEDGLGSGTAIALYTGPRRGTGCGRRAGPAG
ncbi:glycosyltransferase [Streptomyces sp. NPDC024017]|uniref:glycosyltransferase n=1 Tax=Streptomyces sp. NPDC024017 TaxID=3154326 RepID=UPI0033F6D689